MNQLTIDDLQKHILRLARAYRCLPEDDPRRREISYKVGTLMVLQLGLNPDPKASYKISRN